MKTDEAILLTAIESNGGKLPDHLMEGNSWMPAKRMIYLLRKWAGRGTWEYGVSLRTGWLVKKESA